MKGQVFATLENSRNYTLQVADAMPEKSYTFKPAGAGWNFGELLHHIAYGITWWEENQVKGNEVPWSPPPLKGGKAEIVASLKKAYDGLKKTLEQEKLSEKAVQGFHATLDHITHHRGQTVVYLRCHGIDPPEYTY